jgi:hypothetical protein
MRFYRDFTQAEPVIRDIRIYDASATGIIAGQAVKAAAAAATEGNGGAIDSDATSCIDIIGVTAEAPTSALSVVATGTEKFCKVIINPFATYLAEVDETNAGTNTSAAAETFTVTFSANNIGGWVYCNYDVAGGGDGNILAIGNVSTTATAINVTGTAYDDELGTMSTAATGILLPPCWQTGVTGGGIDLDSTFSKIDGKPAPTGAAVVAVDWFINSQRFPMERMVIDRHAGRKDSTAKFYGEIYFADHFIGGAATIA